MKRGYRQKWHSCRCRALQLPIGQSCADQPGRRCRSLSARQSDVSAILSLSSSLAAADLRTLIRSRPATTAAKTTVNATKIDVMLTPFFSPAGLLFAPADFLGAGDALLLPVDTRLPRPDIVSCLLPRDEEGVLGGLCRMLNSISVSPFSLVPRRPAFPGSLCVACRALCAWDAALDQRAGRRQQSPFCCPSVLRASRPLKWQRLVTAVANMTSLFFVLLSPSPPLLRHISTTQPSAGSVPLPHHTHHPCAS